MSHPISPKEQLHRSGTRLLECAQVLDDVVPAGAGEADAMQDGGTPALDAQQLLYCERAIELLIDLLSQLPTRRFVRTLLDDRAVLIKCRMSPLFSHPDGEALRCLKGDMHHSAVLVPALLAMPQLWRTSSSANVQWRMDWDVSTDRWYTTWLQACWCGVAAGRLFRQLVDLFQFYQFFPIDDHTGDPITDADQVLLPCQELWLACGFTMPLVQSCFADELV